MSNAETKQRVLENAGDLSLGEQSYRSQLRNLATVQWQNLSDTEIAESQCGYMQKELARK